MSAAYRNASSCFWFNAMTLKMDIYLWASTVHFIPPVPEKLKTILSSAPNNGNTFIIGTLHTLDMEYPETSARFNGI